jgi:hypothetical protein
MDDLIHYVWLGRVGGERDGSAIFVDSAKNGGNVVAHAKAAGLPQQVPAEARRAAHLAKLSRARIHGYRDAQPIVDALRDDSYWP